MDVVTLALAKKYTDEHGVQPPAQYIKDAAKSGDTLTLTKIIPGGSETVVYQPSGIGLEYIELSGWDESEGWHSGGTITEEQATILTKNELNYIWMNGMHRLDFRYVDKANNKSTYASSDRQKTHTIEVDLTNKTWRYCHDYLQEKLTAGEGIKIEDTTISCTVTGKVEDVKVDGTSVVVDKVANIDLTGKQDTLIAGDKISISGDNVIGTSATEVSVSDTGTATDVAKFITIDGVEKKLAGADIPTNVVTTDTEQVISARKTFTDGIVAAGGGDQAVYTSNSILSYSTQRGGTNTYFFPVDAEDGTFALIANVAAEETRATAAETNLQTQVNTKSTVSASATGTATDEVQYITIDGVEKKLAGSSGEDKVFIAEYNVTTLAEVVAAKDAGKAIFVKIVSSGVTSIIPLAYIMEEESEAVGAVFSSAVDFWDVNMLMSIALTKTGWADPVDIRLETLANKIKAISEASTDDQYPSAKATYTALTAKQNKLTAGTNINIDESTNTISADDQLPAYPTDTTKKYVLGLKYENNAWVKYWAVMEDETSSKVGVGKVGSMIVGGE